MDRNEDQDDVEVLYTGDDAVVIQVGNSSWRVSREAAEAKAEEYKTGRDQFEGYAFCISCGGNFEGKQAAYWGSDAAICDCITRYVEPSERLGEQIDKMRKEGGFDLDKLDIPEEDGIVTPHCSYCGKEMEIILPVAAGFHTKFVWACPDKHSNVTTDSPDGIEL